MSEITDSIKRDLQPFNVEIVEPTRNGVWIERLHKANGEYLKSFKCSFITKTELRLLLAEIEELETARHDK